MSSEDPLLDKADALMRRHRVFVAGAQAEAELAPGVDNGSDAGADDLPLLTEVVGTAPPVATDQAGQAAGHARFKQLLAEHHAALALELERWLDEQLPQLVIRAMDGITDHLVALITNRAREELLPRLDAILVPAVDSRVLVPAVDSGVLVPATSSGSSALQAPTVDSGVLVPATSSGSSALQAPTVDSGVLQPSDEAVPRGDSERPG